MRPFGLLQFIRQLVTGADPDYVQGLAKLGIVRVPGYKPLCRPFLIDPSLRINHSRGHRQIRTNATAHPLEAHVAALARSVRSPRHPPPGARAALPVRQPCMMKGNRSVALSGAAVWPNGVTVVAAGASIDGNQRHGWNRHVVRKKSNRGPDRRTRSPIYHHPSGRTGIAFPTCAPNGLRTHICHVPSAAATAKAARVTHKWARQRGSTLRTDCALFS
jgi:hypothetical protein